MFVSDLSNAFMVPVDRADVPTADGQRFGYIPRDYERVPVGSIEYAEPFNLPLIPRSEWRDRIEEMEKTKSRISDIRRQQDLKSSNQNGLSYCWIHGCCNALRLVRAINGQPYAELEPTSAGAIIKKYRNVGGNTYEAIRHLAEVGVATRSVWPQNEIDRSLDTPEMRQVASRYRIKEWWELKANSFDQLATCLLLRMPCPIGLSWWGHLVCAMDLVAMDGGYGIRIWNSWKDSWGDRGEGILAEKKGTAFDQFALRAVTVWGNAV